MMAKGRLFPCTAVEFQNRLNLKRYATASRMLERIQVAMGQAIGGKIEREAWFEIYEMKATRGRTVYILKLIEQVAIQKRGARKQRTAAKIISKPIVVKDSKSFELHHSIRRFLEDNVGRGALIKVNRATKKTEKAIAAAGVKYEINSQLPGERDLIETFHYNERPWTRRFPVVKSNLALQLNELFFLESYKGRDFNTAFVDLINALVLLDK